MDFMAPLWGLFRILSLAVLVVQLWALIDAAIRPQQAFVATDKQTKNLWLVLLGVTVVANAVLGGGSLLGIFTIVGLIVALIYLVDVRPAVRQVGRPGG